MDMGEETRERKGNGKVEAIQCGEGPEESMGK